VGHPNEGAVIVSKKTQRLPTRRAFTQGLSAGALVTVILYSVTGVLNLPFPPEAIFQLLISPVPGAVQSIAVETLREYAKYSAFVVASAFFAITYGLIAVGLSRFLPVRATGRNIRALLGGAAIPTVIGLGFEYALASRVSTLSSLTGWLTATAVLVMLNLGYSSIVVSQFKSALWPIQRKQVQHTAGESSRRSFLKKVTVATVVIVVGGLLARIGLSVFSGQPIVRSTAVPVNPEPEAVEPGLPAIFQDPRIRDLVGSEVTDNRIFYRVDINPIPPKLDFDGWALNVSGKITNPMTVHKDDLLAFPTTEQFATLECISNTIDPPGGLISNAKWAGVPLATLLEKAKPTADAKYVIFRCADGYTVGIPLDRAMQPGALLAYRMNDEYLPDGHGFPLRAIVPGIYGMMNAKWITAIELSDQVYLGYWQERGWSNDARIKTTSIIYYPPSQTQVNEPIPIAGAAFAGDRGISKVEVSTDGGNTWSEATLKKPKSRYSWVLWAYEWNPSKKGNHLIIARATDGDGVLQDATPRGTFPNGATGYGSVAVTVA